jgi:hypothetical protein
MSRFKAGAAILLVCGTVSCASDDSSGRYSMSSRGAGIDIPAGKPVPMDLARKVAEQDCSRPVDFFLGNLRCK